jgi:predicted O-linked N-acetylglucosamine transferase (SPINDLY family)
MELNPGIPYLPGDLLHTKMLLCDWQGLDSLDALVATRIVAGEAVADPFEVLAAPISTLHQRQCAEVYVNNKYPAGTIALWNGKKYTHDRIRLGYLSADLFQHATAGLMAGLFELHDRSRFEVTAFSFGPPSNDAMRQRLEKSFEHSIEVRDKSDQEIAKLARDREIDIAVDLKRFTNESRPGIFARRPAPVQVSYLGYPGTMGAPYIDYLIADATLIPKDQRRHYIEKIAYLPNSYQVNDSTRPVAVPRFSRRDMGLPEQGFVLCSFNNNYKITPQVFDIWMRLLRKVDGSVLWLLEANETAAKNLRAEARARGVGDERLVFAKRVGWDAHMARHRLADLFLDTFPCNAHTTASDALWEGLPILTCLGETFVGRVAASLLHAVGLPELVTHSHTEYESLALALATDPRQLSGIRQKLAQNRTTHPLFDTALSTKHIEDAYAQMMHRCRAGLPPTHFYVQG